VAVTEQSEVASRAIDELYRKHGAEVYRYALAVLGSHPDAEDVTQTTFLNAYRAIEQGVHPRKPANWLLTIASNAIKQKFRQESGRPRQVVLDAELAGTSADDEGPTMGELLTALSRIPPQQRQAIVLREFEGRSYKEIAEILGVTTAALETLLFRARRSLAEELEQQLTCTEAQLAVSRAADGRLGRKERRRLREHLGECADCARFARLQQRNRTALRGLVLMPVPISLILLKGLEDTAAAAVLPASGGVGAGGAAAAGGGIFAGGTAGGGILAGGVTAKAAAVVAAASVAGGVGVVGATETASTPKGPPAKAKSTPGERLGQTAPRGTLVPGRGVARGKATAPGQPKAVAKRPAHATRNASTGNPRAQQAKAAADRRRAEAGTQGKATRAMDGSTPSGASKSTRMPTEPIGKQRSRLERASLEPTPPASAEGSGRLIR
jgi:RNA polymerase sigma factor (sigma-70 family)